MADLVIPKPAQRELEEIALLHLNLVGPDSARNITNLILDTLSRLERFPLSGHIPQDKELRNGGYRYVIAGKYICVYRLIAGTVYVYHMAHGASNYPTLFKRLMKEENPRSRPDTMKPSATQCKKILGNTRFFTVSNPIWYHAS